MNNLSNKKLGEKINSKTSKNGAGFKSVSPQADFPSLEKELLEKWEKENVVHKYLRRNDSSSKNYSFLDGPITANNPMGVHHAWGRMYKDLWQRFWNMRGYRQRFQNGFDCQGLWVEVEVEKELGIRNKKDIENLVEGNKKESIAKFVELCKQRVIKYSGIQAEQSKRLGYFMDWDNSYYTMSDENNYMIWHFLKTCFDKGWIYKGKDSVPWCPRCETAISQHEMLTEDYKELTHESVFVKLPINSKGFDKTYLLIWTTTPWTIPANVSVGINKKFIYGLYQNKKTKEKIVFIEKDELGNIPIRDLKGNQIPVSEYILGNLDGEWERVDEIKGEKLLGTKYLAPFDDLPIVNKAQEENPHTFHTVVDGSEIVVSTEGTGLLHIAPGAGKEDFDLGKKEKLSVISLISDDASYLEGMGEFSGKNAKKHPELIIDFLKSLENGKYLLKTMPYTHRYPACWRCKTELVWKVTYEWYIAMDLKEKGKNGKTLREQMMDTAKMIDWRPKFGLERELDWLSNMHDWLISKKNRYWGLALPVFECQSCGNFEVLGSKEELKKRAVEGWDKFEGHSPHKPYIDEVRIKCFKCGEKVSRVDDVGNVWLDAGIVPFSTYVDPKTKKLSYTTDKKYWEEWFPAEFITESFPGQFKNWFYSMIAMSTVLEKKNPFKTVLGFALMLGEDGRPMHKSWGNSIEFNEGADKIGVDVMRWMFATHNPENNLLFGYKKADETRRRFHLILWNIYNFFLTYREVDGWEPTLNQKLKIKNQNVLDRWILSRLNKTIEIVTISLEEYDAQKASFEIENFVNDLSLWFVRRSRDRVGPSAEDEKDKNNCYETLYFVLVNLSKMLAPFIPFISEEMYTNLTNEISVHLSDWPLPNSKLVDENLEEEMIYARALVESAHGLRKQSEVKVRIPIKEMLYNGPKELSQDILNIVRQEINVYNLNFNKKEDVYNVFANTSDDNLDLQFGLARDIVRKVQEERKNLGTKPNEKVKIIIPFWPKEHEDYIKKKALAVSITEGEKFSVTKDE
ncbi:MAG: isoleucine--tRNA ligase [Patescibacteria group bacterium]|nr:isoleucine--tRNA ligase [Patescibacteria group bacterium]